MVLTALSSYPEAGWSSLPATLPASSPGRSGFSRDRLSETPETLIAHERWPRLPLREKRGLIRWLRPDFQNPSGKGPVTQAELGTDQDADEEETAATTADRRVWPKALPEQIRAVAEVVITADRWLSLDDIAVSFKGRGRWKERLPQILETLVAIGRLREKDGRFVA